MTIIVGEADWSESESEFEHEENRQNPFTKYKRMFDNCYSTLLINEEGIFNFAGIEKFGKEVGMDRWGVSYTVVSIIGPQSSGKSTLLNHLFHTDFTVMDGSQGRYKTTKGIWMAKSAGIEPCTLVLDLEGTDGSEREDDTAFEKWSALFALAVSDIVLINMWCHDIGRENAANRPLLRTVFEVVMRLFSIRKTTLMFVIRDLTKSTPLEALQSQLREDIQKIWDSIPKTPVHKGTSLSEFFKVEVVAFSSYEDKEEQFKEQVASLRQRFFRSLESGGFAADRRDVVPASDFSFSAQDMWEKIKENKDLDLPAHQVMISSARCGQIVKDKMSSFDENKVWCQLSADVQSNYIPIFGKMLKSLLDNCLSEYDAETLYYDEGVRHGNRMVLEEMLHRLVRPACKKMLGHLQSRALANFEATYKLVSIISIQSSLDLFDKECADVLIIQVDDMSEARNMLEAEMKARVAAMRSKLYKAAAVVGTATLAFVVVVPGTVGGSLAVAATTAARRHVGAVVLGAVTAAGMTVLQTMKKEGPMPF